MHTFKHLAFVLCASIGVSGFAQKIPAIKQTSFKKDTVSIVKFGAVNDGVFLNTKSINDAINQVNANGGGVVKIPRGFWLTGPIVLKSNVNLYLETDAYVQFTNDFDQYKIIETNWEGVGAFRNESPIYAKNQTNIAITGGGIIDGWGEAWRFVKKGKLTESQWKNKVASGGVISDDKKSWYPSEKFAVGAKIKNAGVIADGATYEKALTYKDFLRPNLIVLEKCSQILLEGITFQNSAAWNVHPLMSDNIIIRKLKIKNPWYAQNGDGLDLESCSNVLVEDTYFDVGDDAICIKSGRNAEGRKRAMPTQNVLVRNCVVYQAHGGFVVGSEMSGGARNIHVENCTFIGTDIGIRFKTTRGRGGIVENITLNNINMRDIPGEAILFDMYYEAVDPVPQNGEKRQPPKVEYKAVDETTPQFRNISISNVVVSGAHKGIFLRGVPEMSVKNIKMENITIQADQGIDCQEAENISFKNVNIFATSKDAPVYILNSKNISFNGLNYNKTPLLMDIQGGRSKNVTINKADTKGAEKVFEAAYGADAKVINIK